MQLEGFVESDRLESRFALALHRDRAALSERVTAAKLAAADKTDKYKAIYAVILDKRQRGKRVPRTLLARLDAALAAVDEANERVSEALQAVSGRVFI